MRDVLHLDERHGGGFEADAGGRGGEVDEPLEILALDWNENDRQIVSWA